MKRTLDDPCSRGQLDDPATPGLQTALPGLAMPGASTPLPRCTTEPGGATNALCWRLATDPVTCSAFEHAALEIDGRNLLPAAGHVTAVCATAAP